MPGGNRVQFEVHPPKSDGHRACFIDLMRRRTGGVIQAELTSAE
jgi:hypothetical protein